MSLPLIMGWTLGAVGVAGLLWNLVKSVHVKVKVNVRKLMPDDPARARRTKICLRKTDTSPAWQAAELRRAD